MPHSSGGGSSHGGSHSSSRRNSAANMRFGNRFYPGAHRYVYYRNGAPQYYFSDRPYTRETAKKGKISTIISNIFMIFWSVILTVFGFNSLPHKVKLDYNTDILYSRHAYCVNYPPEHRLEKNLTQYLRFSGFHSFAFSSSEDKCTFSLH